MAFIIGLQRKSINSEIEKAKGRREKLTPNL